MKQNTKFSSCQHCTKRQDSVFCSANDETMETIDSYKNCTSFKKGQTIFQEGGYPMGLFCVSNGKVKLSQTGSEGKEQIIRFAKEGDVMGYRALLSKDRYSASAVAMEDTSVCFIPREVFLQIVVKDSNLSIEMMKQLSNDLKVAQEKITLLAQKPVRERVAETLLFLIETFGTEADEQTLSVELSREEIANLVGTATETTIRLLSELKHDGVIQFIGKKIKILNHKELVHIANMYD